VTYATKTKIWFGGAVALVVLSLYCFAGSLMNGSFAIATPELERFHRNAIIFFWLSVASAMASLACLVVGLVRLFRPVRGKAPSARSSAS
jgi:hypothetical protein